MENIKELNTIKIILSFLSDEEVITSLYATEDLFNAGISYLKLNKNTANLACSIGNLPFLVWLSSQKCPILPNVKGANKASGNGRFYILKFLAEKGILPDVCGANWASGNGHLDVVKWLAEKGII